MTLTSGRAASARAAAVDETPDAVTLPREALRDGRVARVEGGRIRLVPVTTGIAGVSRVEITQGVAAGERVVSPFSADVKQGAAVRRPEESLWGALLRAPEACFTAHGWFAGAPLS